MRRIYLSTLALIMGAFTTQLSAQTLPDTKYPVDSTRIQSINSEEATFEKVEVEASVSADLWRKHLENNLLPYIESAARRGIKPGQYTVNVRFLVEKNGSITNVKALEDPGFGLAQGAVRVVRTGPKWNAGEMNGKKVRSYHTQPITFSIQEEPKRNKKGD